MKSKTILVLVLITLLCASIVSAGFMDWLTGNTFFSKIFKAKKTADKVSPPAAAKMEASLPSWARSGATETMSDADFMDYIDWNLKSIDTRMGYLVKCNNCPMANLRGIRR